MRRVSSSGTSLEPLADPVARVRERAFRVGQVVAPHDVADADQVPAIDVVLTRRRRREEAVAVQVVARLHRQPCTERVAELAGVVAADPLLVHLADLVGHPPRRVLGHRVLEVRVALEDAAPDQHRERARRPPAGFRRVDRQHARAEADVARARARVRVQHEAELLGERPQRLVPGVVVRGPVEPAGRDRGCRGGRAPSPRAPARARCPCRG